MENILIIGCGDMGLRVARLALAEHAVVRGAARSPARLHAMTALGIEPLDANLDDPDTLGALPTAGALLFYFAPPPGGGNADTRARNFCASIGAGAEPRRIVYMSTSGVYGDSGGGTITEETPPDPQTARGKRRLDAENVFREWGALRKVDIVILRVTGIYGPGRYPISQLAGGQPVLREEEGFLTNRIHADDLARICRPPGSTVTGRRRITTSARSSRSRNDRSRIWISVPWSAKGGRLRLFQGWTGLGASGSALRSVRPPKPT